MWRRREPLPEQELLRGLALMVMQLDAKLDEIKRLLLEEDEEGNS